MNNAESFLNTLLNDAALRRKTILAMQSDDSTAVEKLAGESGFPCTCGEFRQAFRFSVDAGTFDETELSDEELEALAGSGGCYD